MIEIGIIGARNSGKTTLIEKMASLLSHRGLRVATVKHTFHSHTFDTEGKDTFRHRRAGARFTVGISSADMALFASPDEENRVKIFEFLKNNCDVCFVEGNKGAKRSTILLTRKIDDLGEISSDHIIAVYGPVNNNMANDYFPLDKTEELAEFVIGRFGLQPEDDDHERD
ncbi:MAG: molybdopterin-guanine dinucleotide biosynthesis protein B [candidate division Zixibacteria bacterium]